MSFRPHTIPEHSHPLVRQLFQHMNDKRLIKPAVLERAGLSKSTFESWKKKACPNIANFEAACNAAGLDIILVEKTS